MLKKTLTRLLASALLICGLAVMPCAADAAAQNSVSLEYQHVRNATAKITYGGKTFLVDPFLAPKGAYPGFYTSLDRLNLRIPAIDMAEPAEKVIEGIDAVIVTHTHLDHWDPEAQMILPKNLPLFVQDSGDARLIRSQGFTDVRVVGVNTPFDGITITKTNGQHGTDAMYSHTDVAEILGDAMGFVLQKQGLKTVYFAGDTNWNACVEHAIKKFQPDVIVLNTGYARIKWPDGEVFDGSLIMGTEDVLRAYNAAPKAEIIAVHMDAVNHTMVSSDDLRQYVKAQNITSRVAIPREGETLEY